MLCPKCGNEIPDNSLVCSFCNCDLNDTDNLSTVKEVSNVESEVLIQGNVNINNIDEQEMNAQSNNIEENSSEPVKKKINKKNVIVIVIVGVLIILTALLFVFRSYFASNITLTGYKNELKVGDYLKLNYTIEPSFADGDVEWASSDEDVAIVNDGQVTAVGFGECKISATTVNGKKDSYAISVKASIMEDWEFDSILFEGETYTKYDLMRVGKTDGIGVKIKSNGTLVLTIGSDFDGTWKYENTDEGDGYYILAVEGWGLLAGIVGESDGKTFLLITDEDESLVMLLYRK